MIRKAGAHPLEETDCRNPARTRSRGLESVEWLFHEANDFARTNTERQIAVHCNNRRIDREYSCGTNATGYEFLTNRLYQSKHEVCTSQYQRISDACDGREPDSHGQQAKAHQERIRETPEVLPKINSQQCWVRCCEPLPLFISGVLSSQALRLGRIGDRFSHRREWYRCHRTIDICIPRYRGGLFGLRFGWRLFWRDLRRLWNTDRLLTGLALQRFPSIVARNLVDRTALAGEPDSHFAPWAFVRLGVS